MMKLKGETEMRLNIDDTFEEECINSMHRESDALLNCMNCSRLFYMNSKIARDRLDHNIPLLCIRCRKGYVING